jgi:hypothetical protein
MVWYVARKQGGAVIQGGFATKDEAKAWFAGNVAPWWARQYVIRSAPGKPVKVYI